MTTPGKLTVGHDGRVTGEVTLVRIIQTCAAMPSQWDAWDLDGNYWYLRYRFSRGTAERQPGPDYTTWTARNRTSSSTPIAVLMTARYRWRSSADSPA